MEVFSNKSGLQICVKRKDHVYTRKAGHLGPVFGIQDKIPKLSGSNQYNSRIISLRGAVLSLLDLRKLFRMKSIKKSMRSLRQC